MQFLFTFWCLSLFTSFFVIINKSYEFENVRLFLESFSTVVLYVNIYCHVFVTQEFV